MPLVELMGAIQMLLVEEQRVFAREETGAGRRPIPYPTLLPRIDATVSSRAEQKTLNTPVVAASRPAVTISESPGRKNPTSNPVSAKMIAVSPT